MKFATGMVLAAATASGLAQAAQATVSPTHDWVFNASYASGNASFTTDSITSSQAYAATLQNGVIISNGQAQLANAAGTPSSNAGTEYISLPISAFASTANTGVTMEEWFTTGTNGAHTQNLSLSNDALNAANDGIANGPSQTAGQYFNMEQDNNGYGSLSGISANGWGNAININSSGTNTGAPVAGTSNPANYYLSWMPYGQPLQHMVTTVITPASGSGYGTATYYVDGQLQGSANLTSTDNWSTLAAAFAYAWIGRSPFTGDPLFNGSVKEFRLYNTPLTGSQVQADYASSTPEPGALALMGLGVVGLLLARRGRKTA